MKKGFTTATMVLVLLLALQAYAQEINRLSAQFLNFNGTETFSTSVACGPGTSFLGCPLGAPAGTGGKLVYSKTIFVPFLGTPLNLLYVTISAVRDKHGGESNFVGCNLYRIAV